MTIKETFLEIRKIVRTKGIDVMWKLEQDYFWGPQPKKIIPSCVFCGEENNLTKEHILPKWVFQSDSHHHFISDVNELKQNYIRATVPSCKRCNGTLLNNVELYIQKTLSVVYVERDFYTPEEWDNIIRWLEIIDYKFQVWDIITKFRAHKTKGNIPFFATQPISFVRELSFSKPMAKLRRAYKRIGTKDKSKRGNSLIVARAKEKSFHYFHTSGKFMHLEFPTYKKGFFYFFEKEHMGDKVALKEAMKIIKKVYELV